MIRAPSTTDLDAISNLTMVHCKDAGMDGHDSVDKRRVKQQLREIMIHSNYQMFIAEQRGEIVGYIIGSIEEKFWNAKRYGEIMYIFIHPNIRNKLLLDDLWKYMTNWFLENNCMYYQASVLAHDAKYQQQTEYVNKARKYFGEHNKMNEVGYHFCAELGRDEWAA